MTTFVIERCNPLERADEIRELFARNGHPEFDAVFERAYRPRAATGLKSWIARADGRAVMHISVYPVTFEKGPASPGAESTTTTGGVLGDLMVDEAHRDFWAPVRLVRSMLSDVRREGHIRFLFTTATGDSHPVFKAGGFKPFGEIRRYVTPTHAPWIGMSRLRTRIFRRRRTVSALDDSRIDALLPTLSSGAYWRPRVDAAYFTRGIPRLDFADGAWIRSENSDRELLAMGMFSRHGKLREATIADAFWSGRSRGLAEAALAGAAHARANGYSSLSVTMLDGAGTANELKRAGFFERPAAGDLLVNALHEAPAPVHDWFLTGFFLSSW